MHEQAKVAAMSSDLRNHATQDDDARLSRIGAEARAADRCGGEQNGQASILQHFCKSAKSVSEGCSSVAIGEGTAIAGCSQSVANFGHILWNVFDGVEDWKSSNSSIW